MYLYSTANQRIGDFFARAGLDSGYKNGTLDLDVDLLNYASGNAPVNVNAELFDAAGKKVWSATAKATSSPMEKKQ